jgi:hypothetical protein
MLFFHFTGSIKATCRLYISETLSLRLIFFSNKLKKIFSEEKKPPESRRLFYFIPLPL